MKKILLWVVFMITTLVPSVWAQQNTTTNNPSALLPAYFSIKDALVAGDAPLAATKAQAFLQVLGSTDDKMVNQQTKKTLLSTAGKIAQSKDLKSQRTYFAGFSQDMITLVKTAKIAAEPVYELYCPMQKSSWLSREKTIRNPYYGNAMLSCGKVAATIP